MQYNHLSCKIQKIHSYTLSNSPPSHKTQPYIPITLLRLVFSPNPVPVYKICRSFFFTSHAHNRMVSISTTASWSDEPFIAIPTLTFES